MGERAIFWLGYLPRGLRKAWCELTGGHDNTIAGASIFTAASLNRRASEIRLHCSRCHRTTRWYEVPLMSLPIGDDGPDATPPIPEG